MTHRHYIHYGRTWYMELRFYMLFPLFSTLVFCFKIYRKVWFGKHCFFPWFSYYTYDVRILLNNVFPWSYDNSNGFPIIIP